MNPQPRTDVRLANASWEAVMTAHATLMQAFGAEQVWGDISMREYDVLYTLAKRGEPARMCDVQGGVLLSQPALSRMIDRLVARDLVSRDPDPDDRRAVRLSLTAKGTRVQQRVGRAHAKSVAQKLSRALTPEEMRTLEQLAGKLAATT